MAQNPVEPLSWKGYSQSKRVYLNSFAQSLSEPQSLYDNIPFCVESLALMRSKTEQERISIAESLLDHIDHSLMLSPYMAIMSTDRTHWIKQQLQYATHALLRLIKFLSSFEIDGKEFAEIYAAMPAGVAEKFRSAVTTSVHNYLYLNGKTSYPENLDQPLFLEFGADIMMSSVHLMLAEFQVRYSTPYPHLLAKLNEGYRTTFPDLWKKFALQRDDFPEKRLKMLEKAHEMFSRYAGREARKLVIDGWAYLQNSGTNLKELANQLSASYLLFDDLKLDLSADLDDEPLFIFNQPPLYSLDPAEKFFDSFASERMEHYEELGWKGLLQNYLEGRIFFVHPPMTDIVNDKALYEFMPYLCRFFGGQTLELPVVTSMQCWNGDEPSKPDESAISWAMENKDNCVIAHRYLEGGSGILVGPFCSQDEWTNFLQMYVLDRPYLYVLREYFPMNPDLSMRVLVSALSPSRQLDSAEEILVANSFLARYSAQSPLTLRTSRCFSIFETAVSS